jgi:hypothetical protein
MTEKSGFHSQQAQKDFPFFAVSVLDLLADEQNGSLHMVKIVGT